MAIRRNADGSITIGIIREEEPKPVKAEAPKAEKPKKTVKKKG